MQLSKLKNAAFLIIPKLNDVLWCSIILCIGFEAVSVLANLLMGAQSMAWPWSCISLFINGNAHAVMIALLYLACVASSIFYYWQGGIERAFGVALLSAWALFTLANSLAIISFNLWQGTAIIPWPWDSYAMFAAFPFDSYQYATWIESYHWSIGTAAFTPMAWLLWNIKNPFETVFGKAHFANVFEAKKAGLFSAEGLVLGKAFGKIVKLGGFEGVLVNAPMGSGKTTSIAIPNLLEWQGSAIINDLKGELYTKTHAFRQHQLHNRCIEWAPANPNKHTARYNPFFYVSQNNDERIRDLQLIAEIIIPAERIDGGFWYTSSREIFMLLALYLFEIQGMATLQEIHDISKQGDFIVWLSYVVQEGNIEEPVFYQNAHSLLNADKDKTQKNIIKDFHSRMGLFADPLVRHATSGNDFDVRNLRKEKMSIYIQIPDSDKERLRPLLTLFWAQCIHALTQQEPDIQTEPYPVLALLDEFGNMARINKLKDGTAFFRSYRIRAMIIVQYFAQIVSVYGEHDAKGFLNSKIKIAFALNDADDATFFSKAMGTKTVKTKSHNTGTGMNANASHTTSYQARPLMAPDEIMQLKPTDAIILMEAQPTIKAKKCYWFKERKYKRLLVDRGAIKQIRSG